MSAIRTICQTCFMVAFLVSCASQPVTQSVDAPGFFSGLWNGFSSPFSLVGSIFLDIRIYAFPNTGGGYDLGFMLGLLPWAGALANGNTKQP